MKKFVVSDLHGQGDIYFSIIKYLEKFNEEIILYINGDVIDRGPDSISILQDILKRNNIMIELLAGNHELMMLDYLFSNEIGKMKSPWTKGNNGGRQTFDDFKKLDFFEKANIISLLQKSKMVIKLEEKIFDYYGIVISHANPVKNDTKFDSTLKDALYDVELHNSLWYRDESYISSSSLGLRDYLNIVGHTPNQKVVGYSIDKNILNIDGGAAAYELVSNEDKRFIHVPLVELDTQNNKLNVTSFSYTGNIYLESEVVQEEGNIIVRGR